MKSGMKIRFPITWFLLRLTLVIILVLLLVWLFPMPNLIAFYNSIYSDNIEIVKKGALNYYTVDRLPKLVGYSSTMTVEEMVNKKIIMEFVDKNGKKCHEKISYVEVKNNGDSYTMKIYLSCENEANYIIVPMGCYDRCNLK